ncbi:MAG: YdgH/BhsA/McbA family protein [Planctomycetota bacterium]
MCIPTRMRIRLLAAPMATLLLAGACQSTPGDQEARQSTPPPTEASQPSPESTSDSQQQSAASELVDGSIEDMARSDQRRAADALQKKSAESEKATRRPEDQPMRRSTTGRRRSGRYPG